MATWRGRQSRGIGPLGGECALLPVPWPGADADGSGPGQTLFFSGNLGRPPQLHFLMDGGEKRLHN